MGDVLLFLVAPRPLVLTLVLIVMDKVFFDGGFFAIASTSLTMPRSLNISIRRIASAEASKPLGAGLSWL